MSEFLDRIADVEWTSVVPPGGPKSLEEAEELRQQSLAKDAAATVTTVE